MNILHELKQGKVLLSDGALGTLLQTRGMQPGECPELRNITHRKDLTEIAEAYLNAGSEIITTNSFGGSRLKLAQYGLGNRVSELNQIAASICRDVAGNLKHVAGSVGPTGKMLIMGDVSEAEIYDGFCEQTIALEKGGADIIIIETMSALDEAILAVRAARENTGCTVIITMTFSKDMKGEYFTMMGVSPAEMVSSAKEAGAHIAGSNCGTGIEEMTGIVKAIRAADNNIPVIIQANAGKPQYVEGKTIFRESPEMMASFVPELIKSGANIIGGCCGTTPEHIRAMARVLEREYNNQISPPF
jgi:5-methyltetrahydrofolate--homocysteine methyltransferase